MHGPPDKPGECNAWLRLSCDHGDNPVTFRCQLPSGHIGQHEERCRAEGPEYQPPNGRNVVTRWLGDDRADLVWREWRMHQWEEAGHPDEWDMGDVPDGWDWRTYQKKLAEQES